jgi:hypothetical protein
VAVTPILRWNCRRCGLLLRAETELEEGDLTKARQFLYQLPAQYDPNRSATAARINLFLYERNTQINDLRGVTI